MALYPLCNHGLELSQAVRQAAAMIQRRELDSIRRADLLTTLGVLGTLRERSLDWISIIGRAQMHESKFFQDVLAEGELVGMRKSVLQVLGARFDPETAQEFAEPLERITQMEQLESLLKLAATSRRLTQFRKAMPEVQGP